MAKTVVDDVDHDDDDDSLGYSDDDEDHCHNSCLQFKTICPPTAQQLEPFASEESKPRKVVRVLAR